MALPCFRAQSFALVRGYACVVEIETEEVEDYMTFPGSQLGPVTKATVSYHLNDDDSGDQSGIVKYEVLWYGSRDPLGCQVFHPLAVREGTDTQIVLRSKESSPRSLEMEAAANALVRVYLDLAFRSALVNSVSLGDASLGPVVSALARENFIADDSSGRLIDPSIVLPIQAPDGSPIATLRYGSPQ
jgi:hypothetical protein